MPLVSWSAQAQRDLEALVPSDAVRADIKRIAEEILHDLPIPASPADYGTEDGIFWRRCLTTEQESQLKQGSLQDKLGGSWDLFLLCSRQNPAGFEVLAVRSIRQVASREMVYRRGSAQGPQERGA